MPKFILAYHGRPKIQSKEQGVEHIQNGKTGAKGCAMLLSIRACPHLSGTTTFELAQAGKWTFRGHR